MFADCKTIRMHLQTVKERRVIGNFKKVVSNLMVRFLKQKQVGRNGKEKATRPVYTRLFYSSILICACKNAGSLNV